MHSSILKRKAQLQMGETFFVLFIIMIIIGLGFVVYSKVKEGDYKEKQREQLVLQMVTLAHTITDWPELECSILDSADFDCIDELKLEVLSEHLLAIEKTSYEYEYYRSLLGKSRVVVHEIYPAPREFILWENTDDKSAETVFVPLNLLNPQTNTFSFAMMELTVYD